MFFVALENLRLKYCLRKCRFLSVLRSNRPESEMQFIMLQAVFPVASSDARGFDRTGGKKVVKDCFFIYYTKAELSLRSPKIVCIFHQLHVAVQKELVDSSF